MSATLIAQSQAVPLSLQVEDGATGLYPQAVVLDETGAVVVGSPFDLVDRGNGLYTSTSLVMGTQDSLHVTYIIYTDVGHTTESDEHLRATDVFVNTDEVVTDVQDAILSDATPFQGADIAAILVDTAAMQPLVDVAISSRSSHSAADVDTQLSGVHGAGSWATATGFAVPGDAMTLTGPAEAALVDAVWDEDIVVAHGTAQTGGLLLRALGANVAGRTNNPTLNAILGVADSAGVDLPEQVNTELEVTQGHGAGSWQSGPTAAAISTQVWSEALPGAFGVGEAGNIVGNRLDANVTSRSSHSAADVDTQLTGSHGAGSWQTATGFAVPGDAMDLVANAVDATAVATDAIDADALAADAVQEIVDGVLDEAVSGHQTAGTVGRNLTAIAQETTATAGSSPTEIRTGLTEADDFYNNMQVVVVNAAGTVARNVDDYANVNGAITVQALPFTPSVGDAVIILRRTGSVPVDAAAISTAVWSEAVPGAFGAGTAGNILGNRLDANVTSRSSHSAADVDTQLTGSHSAGAWTTAIGFAAPGDAMDLVTDAVDAAAVATSGANEIRDAILSDSTPFAGANIDAAISSRSSHSAADVDTVLTASHGAGSWQSGAGGDWTTTEKNQIRGALGIVGTQAPPAGSGELQDVLADTSTMEPLVSTNLDAAVSTRSSHSASDVDTVLTAVHGAGDWTSTSAVDWSTAERNQIRSALGVDGTKTPAVGGQLQTVKDAVVAVDLTVAAGSTAAVVKTDATQANDFFDDQVLLVVNTAGVSASRIDGYANTDGAFTLDPALPFVPTAGDRAIVLNMPIGALKEVWRLVGLDPSVPVVRTVTSMVAGTDLVQSIIEAAGTVTITRTT